MSENTDIKEIKTDIKEIQKDIRFLLIGFKGLEIKSGIWGFAAGAIPTLIFIGIMYIKKVV